MGNPSRIALSICVVALFAGCGGSPPIGAPGTMPQSRATAKHAERGGSWMLPEAKSDDLVYVSSTGGSVYVFSYPAGTLVGTISGLYSPVGECSDKHGDVFITVDFAGSSRAGYVYEFAHGGTSPIAMLSDSDEVPFGCAVDPVTGNLAVANLTGTIAIYPHAQGTPTSYRDPEVPNFRYCTYDSNGTLFADGYNGGYNYIVELPASGESLQNIALGHALYIGSLQWNGTYLAAEDLSGGANGPTTIDWIAISGSGARVVGSTVLKTRRNKRSGGAVQYWIQGKAILGPAAVRGAVSRDLDFWAYPQGGNAQKTLRPSGSGELWGTTVSLAPH